MRRHIAVLGIFILVLAMASCTKLDRATGPLIDTTKFADAIPQDYGPLIGVTHSPDSPGVGLWFQKSDGTVVAVFVNAEEGTIHPKTLMIPRK